MFNISDLRRLSTRLCMLFIFLFILTKDVLAYDEEKVTVLCILSFILLAYINSRDAVSAHFEEKYDYIKNCLTD